MKILCLFGFLLLLCGCISNSCYCVGTFQLFCCRMLLCGCCGCSLLLCCAVGALQILATVGVFSMFGSPLLFPPCYFNVWLPPAMLLWVHFKLLPTIQLENELGKQYKSLDGRKIYLPRDKWLFTLLTINCQNLFLSQQ